MRIPRFWQSSASLGLLVLSLSACTGHRETYAILPDREGHAANLTVKAKGAEPVQVSGAFAAVQARPGGTAQAGRLSEQEIKAAFGDALAARPDAPVRFTLYFRDGSDELTADSKRDFENVLKEIAKRPAADVIVVGHTDRVGLMPDNDRLALRRAEKMRAELVSHGVPDENIQAAGRGEREPLVVTADEVAEPRNRRVEMLVR